EQLTSQKILKQVNDLCDNITRQFNNAMAYREDPVQVIPAKDVDKAITVETEFPEKYQATLEDIKSNLESNNNELHRLNGNYCALSASFSTLSGKTMSLEAKIKELNIEKSALEKQIEALNTDGLDRFVRNVKRHFKQWFSIDNVFIGLLSAMAIVLVTCIIYMLANTYWSADSLARRAYDTAVEMEWKNPGRFYQEIRSECKENGKKSGRQLVEYYESLAEDREK
ncbi:MAG: hypothetical protein ACI4TM_09750, partial [Candidatus Cryptobacteroides sp.]